MGVYDDYYLNQAGGKLPVFQGTKYQRGHGFFGRLFKYFLPVVKSALPTVGKHALSTGLSIGKDLIEGETFANSTNKRLKETGSNLINEISEKFGFKQKGSGRKRRKRKNRMPFFRKPFIKSKVKQKKKTKKISSKKRKNVLGKSIKRKNRKGSRKRRRKNKKCPDFLK